jgi:hypothetical protein
VTPRQNTSGRRERRHVFQGCDQRRMSCLSAGNYPYHHRAASDSRGLEIHTFNCDACGPTKCKIFATPSACDLLRAPHPETRRRAEGALQQAASGGR